MLILDILLAIACLGLDINFGINRKPIPGKECTDVFCKYQESVEYGWYNEYSQNTHLARISLLSIHFVLQVIRWIFGALGFGSDKNSSIFMTIFSVLTVVIIILAISLAAVKHVMIGDYVVFPVVSIIFNVAFLIAAVLNICIDISDY